MPRKLKSNADILLPYLSPTPADTAELMDELGWTLAKLEDACYGIRAMGIRLDTRHDQIRVLPSSWELAERRAIEADSGN